MKNLSRGMMTVAIATLLAVGLSASAQMIYVANEGTNDVANNFNTWEGAATNIHDAVALAYGLSLNVMVSNGVYGVTNQLVVSNITVRSQGGPSLTTVYRIGTTGTNFPIWRVYSGGYVSGFTVTNGHWDANGSVGGAFHMTGGTVSNCVMTLNNRIGGSVGYDNGILSASGGALITDCIISNNSSRSWNVTLNGAGTTMRNTTFTRNTAPFGSTGLRIYSGAAVERCRIVDNDSSLVVVHVDGASKLENCLIWGNRNTGTSGTVNMSGAGGRIVHCTIASNDVAATSTAGGLVRAGGTVTNSIIYGNLSTVPQFSGDAASVWHSCAPELTADVQGNININPMFASMQTGDCRLALGSPAANKGVQLTDVTLDLAGNARDATPDMGAFEWVASGGPLQVAFSGLPLTGIGSVTSVFTAVLDGTDTDITWWGWDFDNNGTFEQAGSGLQVVTNVFTPGRYSVTLRVTNNTLETASATLTDYITVASTNLNVYVSTNGTATFPFETWAKATANLNDAFANVARAGSTVWISNGVFGVTAELTLNTNITVTSMNGPQATTVFRTQTGSTVTYPIFRLTHAAALVSGVTITNGFWNVTGRGGSIDMTGGTVTNCWIINTPFIGPSQGGAVYMTGGLVTHSVISNSQPRSFALRVAGGTIQDSLITRNYDPYDTGPIEVMGGTMRRCRVEHNSANAGIGGLTLSSGLIENTLIVSNRTPGTALSGGVLLSGGRLVNSTITGNSNAVNATVGSGVNRTGGSITNSIIYGNIGAGGTNYTGLASAVWYSCAPELTPDVQGNINGDPLFTSAATMDFTLALGSPAINTGTNLHWTLADKDLAGDSRVRMGVVDMGCFEASPPPGSLILLR